jgi:hypothetical protein
MKKIVEQNIGIKCSVKRNGSSTDNFNKLRQVCQDCRDCAFELVKRSTDERMNVKVHHDACQWQHRGKCKKFDNIIVIIPMNNRISGHLNMIRDW